MIIIKLKFDSTNKVIYNVIAALPYPFQTTSTQEENPIICKMLNANDMDILRFANVKQDVLNMLNIM